MDLSTLREDINKLGSELRAIVAKASEEKRELTADENIAFDKMNADRDAKVASEARLLKVAEIEGATERRVEPRIGTPERRTESRKGEVSSNDRLESLRAWLQTGTPLAVTPEQRQICERIGVNPNAKQFRLVLPNTTPKSTRDHDFNAWEQRALSTLSTTSPEDGNYLIANEMMGPLERALLAYGGVRQVATIKRTGTGATYPIPTNDDTSNKGALLAENTIAVEKDPAFGQLVLNAFKFTSKKVLLSLELMQDSSDNLASTLGEMLGERIGRITNDYFTTGTGTNEPKGIVAAATNSSVQFAAKTPTYAELVGIEHAVDPAYRNGGGWMFHDTLFAEIKKITDASTGRPIWLPNMVQGAPDTILGYPYTINQSMAVAAGSGAAKSALFGRLSKYIIRDVKDITLVRLDELYAEYYQVAFVAFSRHDGDLLDAGTHPVVYALNKT